MSLPYLDEAQIDYQTENLGGQLTIKAPNAKMPKVTADSPVEQQVNYVLHTEINPGLASHGGDVSLLEITEDMVAVLKFGGGCQGCVCGHYIKRWVEKTLLEKVPALSAVRDETDHSDSENAYYKA